RKQEAAYTTSWNLAEKLRERHGDFEVFGAQECPIEKVRENYRFQVILRSRKASSAMKALSDVLSEVKIPSAVTLEVDVDPLDML
ncbi:MAG: hypothetical protein MJ052_05480, partial [Sphaerochaetaceae bacterium]|nr:hypothetical protein [Sphaerochaetaceae bacterium]